MDKEQAAIVRMKLNTFKSTMTKASDGLKSARATAQLVNFFNQLRDAVATLDERIASQLPAKLSTRSKFDMIGQTDVTYLDLEVMTDQILETVAFFENRQ